jgi:hypothetical protein
LLTIFKEKRIKFDAIGTIFTTITMEIVSGNLSANYLPKCPCGISDPSLEKAPIPSNQQPSSKGVPTAGGCMLP